MSNGLMQWIDDHGYDDNDENTAFDYVEVEIEFGYEVFYACIVEVETYHGRPVNACVVKMTRVMIDEDGYETYSDEVETKDYPHYIKQAAEKKAMGL